MKSVFQLLLKGLLVGTAYAATLAITKILVSEMVNARSFLWSFVGGAAMGFVLGSLASAMHLTWSSHMLVWGSIIFFNIVSVTIEGHIFAPNLIRSPLIVVTVQQLVVALVTTWTIIKLFAPIADSAPMTSIHRSWFSWLWRFVLSALSYVFFYYVFGAIAYLLITGPYYEMHAGGLVVPAQNIIFQTELIRATLMVLSAIPLMFSFSANKRSKMWLTGLILFVVGGLTPLLVQVGSLPSVVLAASSMEIFCQNFFTGIVTAKLLSSDITKQ